MAYAAYPPPSGEGSSWGGLDEKLGQSVAEEDDYDWQDYVS